MRVLQGTRVMEFDAAHAALQEAGRVVVDVGAGDGRWAYESARADPTTLYVALDPDADSLKEYAYRASRKPSRGGAANVLFVVASVEDPPPELRGIAHEVKVLFPWAALLRGLLEPQAAVLKGLKAIGRPGAAFEFVLTYDASHDHGAGMNGAGSLDRTEVERLIRSFAGHGLVVGSVDLLGRDEALAIPSSWGRRLLHGRERQVFRLEGRFLD